MVNTRNDTRHDGSPARRDPGGTPQNREGVWQPVGE